MLVDILKNALSCNSKDFDRTLTSDGKWCDESTKKTKNAFGVHTDIALQRLEVVKKQMEVLEGQEKHEREQQLKVHRIQTDEWAQQQEHQRKHSEQQFDQLIRLNQIKYQMVSDKENRDRDYSLKSNEQKNEHQLKKEEALNKQNLDTMKIFCEQLKIQKDYDFDLIKTQMEYFDKEKAREIELDLQKLKNDAKYYEINSKMRQQCLDTACKIAENFTNIPKPTSCVIL